MKKILVVLLSLLVVGAVFGNVVTTSTDIPVNVTILRHVEITTGGSFDFVLDPVALTATTATTPDIGVLTDDATVTVKANYNYTLSADYFNLLNTGFDLDPYLTISRIDTVAKEAGVNEHKYKMTFDYASFNTEYGWTATEAFQKNQLGKVVVTVSAEEFPVEPVE